MSYKDSIKAISSRELKTATATAPTGYEGKGGGLAYGLLYLAGVFGFSIAVSKGKGMKGMKR